MSSKKNAFPLIVGGLVIAGSADAAGKVRSPDVEIDPVATDLLADDLMVEQDIAHLFTDDLFVDPASGGGHLESDDSFLIEVDDPDAVEIELAQTWGGGTGNDGIMAPRPGSRDRLDTPSTRPRISSPRVTAPAETGVNRKGKQKRTGWVVGKRGDIKRALVTLAPGDTIDIFGV